MKKIFLTIALSSTVLSGCVSLSPSDNAKLNELRAAGIAENAVIKKNPGVAGALNILPGIGNFYLASGTREGSQWTYGFLNLLFWPGSVIWGIPQAAIDADTINKMETVYYFTYDPEGKRQLEARKAASGQAPVINNVNQSGF